MCWGGDRERESVVLQVRERECDREDFYVPVRNLILDLAVVVVVEMDDL